MGIQFSWRIFVNNGNSFCNDFQIDEDLADFSSISGYLVILIIEQYPSQALAYLALTHRPVITKPNLNLIE